MKRGNEGGFEKGEMRGRCAWGTLKIRRRKESTVGEIKKNKKE